MVHQYSSEVPLSIFEKKENSEVEPMTLPSRGMRDIIFLDTITIGIADTLPFHHADDNGLVESIACSKEMEDELITFSPSNFLSIKGDPQFQILNLQQIVERGLQMPMQ